MAEDRTYSDEEVKEILTAAADRQANAESAMIASRPGMSLVEIEQIAQEAGIDPAHVRAAVLKRKGRRGTAVQTRGPKGHPVLEAFRHLPTEVTDETWGRIVTELRSSFGVMGAASDYGETREWVSADGATTTDAIQVTLEREGEGSRVRMRRGSKSARELATVLPATLFMVAFVIGLLMVLTGPGDAPWGLPVAIAAAGVAGAAVGRPALKSWEGKKALQFDETLDRIELIAGRGDPGSDPEAD